MASITDGFDIPIMHQDLRDFSLGMVNMPFGGAFGTNLLGGVQMRPILRNDQFQVQNKSAKSSLKTLKTIGLAAVGLITAAVLKGKYNSWSKPNWLLKLFGKAPKSVP